MTKSKRDRPIAGFATVPAADDDFVEEIARLIYDAVFLPGEVVDDDIMPTFEQARVDSIGGYGRAVEAAALVVCRIRRQELP